MDLVLHVTRFQLRAFLRNRRARMLTLIFPLILLALLGGRLPRRRNDGQRGEDRLPRSSSSPA